MNISYRSLSLALLCAFLGSVKGYLVSQVKTLSAIEIFGIRSVGATCFLLPIMIFFSYKLWYNTKRNTLLFARSIVGNIAVCGYYFGFVNLPIAEASILYYCTPVFTIIIGCLWFKERCRLTDVSATIISIGGVIAVSSPQFTAVYSKSAVVGIIGSLIGAIAQALALAVIKKLTDIPPYVVSFWWSSIGILFSSVLSTTFHEIKIWTCGWEAAFLCLISCIGFISEICLVYSLKSTDPIVVSLALTSEIMWAFVLQYFASFEVPSMTTCIGGTLIGASIVLPIAVKLYSKGIYKDAKTSK